MWSERVDAANFFMRVWPRASAMAEVLWSGAAPRTVPQGPHVEGRLARFRCFMVQQFGIAASPVIPDFCDGVDGLLEGPRKNDNPLGYFQQPIAHGTESQPITQGTESLPAWTILLLAVFLSAAFGYAARGLRCRRLVTRNYSDLMTAEFSDNNNAELELSCQGESEGVYS